MLCLSMSMIRWGRKYATEVRDAASDRRQKSTTPLCTRRLQEHRSREETWEGLKAMRSGRSEGEEKWAGLKAMRSGRSEGEEKWGGLKARRSGEV